MEEITITTRPSRELHYRVSRPDLYDDPGCPGHNNPSARQGHYYFVATAKEAVEQASKQFPRDLFFDVQEVFEGTVCKATRYMNADLEADLKATLPDCKIPQSV